MGSPNHPTLGYASPQPANYSKARLWTLAGISLGSALLSAALWCLVLTLGITDTSFFLSLAALPLHVAALIACGIMAWKFTEILGSLRALLLLLSALTLPATGALVWLQLSWLAAASC